LLTTPRRIAFAAALLLPLSGEASAKSWLDNIFGSKDEPGVAGEESTEAAGAMYNKALAKMKDGEYKTAAKQFGEVERQHPYSGLATKAILMQAYSHYQRNSYDDAINAAQRFIALHPGHKDTPYAYYLVALSNYERILDVKRDQSQTQKALDSLDEVSRRYPGTKYAADAENKAILARDHLAGKELEVGRYYLKKGSYLGAINRYKRVVTDYQTTSHVPEALYRLTEAYLALGVRSEAQTAAAVLGQNFPASDWYKDAYALLQNDGLSPTESKSSWISSLF
jgi:outer membrane protein assembly factor BamD